MFWLSVRWVDGVALPNHFRFGFDEVVPFGFFKLRAPRGCFGWGGGGLYFIRNRGGRGFDFVVPVDLVESALSHPDCPFVLVGRRRERLLEVSDFFLRFKPGFDFVWCNTQLWLDFMTSDKRLRARAHAEEALNAKKAESLLRLREPGLERIKRGLSEEQRLSFVEIKGEVLGLVQSGKLGRLSNLEIERLVLLKLIEVEGLMRLVENPGRYMNDKEAQAYVNLTRMMGNEGQRMFESNVESAKDSKSVFSELESLVKSGVEVTLSKRESAEVIDAEYDDLLDDIPVDDVAASVAGEDVVDSDLADDSDLVDDGGEHQE